MAAQHSQSFEAWLLHIPGLIVIAPSNPYDAKGLLKSAIRSNNPVIFFENKLLYAQTGKVPEEEYIVPPGKASIIQKGKDVTIIAAGAAVNLVLQAIERLESEGISAELVDPRTLFPCDWDTIINSVAKTGRAVVVEEGVLICGFGAECSVNITEALWKRLKAPVRRIAGFEFPIPYAKNLETAVVPGVDRIFKETLELF